MQQQAEHQDFESPVATLVCVRTVGHGSLIVPEGCSMKRLSMGCALLFAGIATAQEMPGVKPGPEHAVLKGMAGNWSGKMKMGGNESDCRSNFQMSCGGLWLASTFNTKMGDKDFQGKGLDGYDPASKKFVSVWVDSMSTKPMTMEGTYDEKTKTMTSIGEGPGPDGKQMKMKLVVTMPDKDTINEKMFLVGPSGDTEMFTIEMKRGPDSPRRGKRGKGEAKPNP
jgi:hypothetical protein